MADKKYMSGKIKTFLSITIVIILTIVFHFVGWLSPIENFVYSFIEPASQLLYTTNIFIDDEDSKLFSDPQKLKEAYLNQKAELLKNKIDQTTFQLTQEENEGLKKQLDFFQRNNYSAVGVNVIGKNTEPTGNTLTIDRGENDGISIGNTVITKAGILVGKITKVNNNFSIVRLINDNQSKIAATIINQDKSIGLVEGGYGISVHMNFIPQNETLSIGDVIVTSGLEENIPRGLLIGEIEAIEKEAYQPFQKAVISPFVNLEKIVLASVIISDNKQD